MTDDLAVTLGRVETSSLEFKREMSDRRAVREAICALANDLGGAGVGHLLIGVDKHGRPFPVDVSDDALLALTSIRDEGKILDRPSMVVNRAVYDGHQVAHVTVHASSTPPVRLDGVVWVRPGPTTRRATGNDERVLNERRKTANLPFDVSAVAGSGKDDLDVQAIRATYIAAAVDPEVLEENDRPVLQQLRSLNLLAPDGAATVLGVLLGGFDPTAWLPGAYLQFVRYSGVDADATIADEEEIRDNLLTATGRLSALLQAYGVRAVVPVAASQDLRERVAVDYPFPALREAVFNAIAHKAYESTNAPIRILWFDDHVEISNPGGPFGTVTAENFDRVNDYRNPSLAAALKTLGYVNRFGRGIERMRAQLRSNGNPEPEFDVDSSTWRVTFRRAS
jgi:ATP-dependent DNA helicase RecG